MVEPDSNILELRPEVLEGMDVSEWTHGREDVESEDAESLRRSRLGRTVFVER